MQNYATIQFAKVLYSYVLNNLKVWGYDTG